MGFGQDLPDSQVCLTDLEKGQRIGLSIIVVASFFSLFTVFILLLLYVRNLVRTYRSPHFTWTIFNTDIDAYFLSLLFSDVLVSLGGIMNLKWVIEGRSTCGDYCSVQGVLQQIGAPGVALSTLAIAVHTFFVIFYKWAPPANRVLGLSVVGIIWVFLILLVVGSWAVHHSSGVHFYTPTPFWCWINQRFVAERLVAGYVYPWLAAFLSIVLYGLLFLKLRGNVVVNPDRWARVRFVWRPARDGNEQQAAVRYSFAGQAALAGSTAMVGEDSATLAQREARKMLWYPLCYTALILPVSIARWLEFRSSLSVPFAATVFTAVVFKFGGVVDVLLFMLTRPNLLLFRGRRQQQHSRPASTPEREPRISDIQIHVEIRERPPTSATPILTSSPSLSPSVPDGGPLESPDSIDTGGGSFTGAFKPLTLDLPTPRISSIFQAWEDLQRVERVHELRDADADAGSVVLGAGVDRNSSKRTGSTSSRSQNGIMVLGGRRSRLGFRKALPSPLPAVQPPELAPEPISKDSMPVNRNRDSNRMSQVWTNVPNEAVGRMPSVARVSATFSVQTHHSVAPSTSAPKRAETVDPPIASVATALTPSRLPIGPRIPPLQKKVRPRTSLEVPSSTAHYIPTSQTHLLLSSRQRAESQTRLRPRSQIVGSAHPHYIRASQALPDSYYIPPSLAQQQQQREQHPRGPRPRPLTAQPSSSSPRTYPFASPDTRVEEKPLPKLKDPESSLELLTMTTSTSSSEVRSRLAADFPVPPQRTLPPAFPQARGTSGTSLPSAERDTRRDEGGLPHRRRAPPVFVTGSGPHAEGSSAIRRAQAEVTGDHSRGPGTAHRSSRSAEREARRKAKGKQRADYVSFMDME